MRPSKINYFFVHSFKIATLGMAALWAIFAIWKGKSNGNLLNFNFVIALVSFSALGWFFGSLFVYPVLMRIVVFKLNGAPFQKGDWVYILVGPHKGRVVQIYEVWYPNRTEVRVEIDEEAKKNFKDIFSFTEICRRA